MYNTPGTMESQGALGCVKDGALVPFEAPKVFDRNGKSLKIIGVGNCTSRLLGEFDPRQFLLERLVLPEDDIAVTAQQYYFRVLFGPVLILVSLVFFVSSFRGYHNPADAPLL